MQIIIHAGAHFTDNDQLVACLMRNQDKLSERGVFVPNPDIYRVALRDMLNEVKRGQATLATGEVFLEKVIGDHPHPVDRLILSMQHFFAVPKFALGNGIIYPTAEGRLANLTALYPDDQIELHLGIRSLATWIPDLFAKSGKTSIIDFLDGADARMIRWSNLFARLREQFPQVAITTWCNEDTPLIWGELIRNFGLFDMNEQIVGGFDILTKIMKREGMSRMRAYFKDHPDLNEVQKRRVIAAFLDKFAIDDEVETVIDIPGWTPELMNILENNYDDEINEIGRIPGVTLIAP